MMTYETPGTPVPETDDDASITSRDINRTKDTHLRGVRKTDLHVLMPQMAGTPTGAGPQAPRLVERSHSRKPTTLSPNLTSSSLIREQTLRIQAERALARMEERLRSLQDEKDQVQEATQAAYVNLEKQLTAAEGRIQRLEMEKEALKRYEAQYLANSEHIMRASVSREIHLSWVEGEGRVLKEHVARLYQEKRQLEDLVNEANRQLEGFQVLHHLVVPGNAPAPL